MFEHMALCCIPESQELILLGFSSRFRHTSWNISGKSNQLPFSNIWIV